MQQLTEQVWNLSVSPHDWRDVYATDYLNKYPAEVLIVAAVLNISIRTVLRRYAKPSTARLSAIAADRLDVTYDAALIRHLARNKLEADARR